MKKIKDNLSVEYEQMVITKFSAIRSINSEVPSKLRPHCSRNFQYHGDDGKETLLELEILYGVLPKILELRLPNGVSFKIDDKGIFTHRDGRFEDIFRIIDDVVSFLLILRDEIVKSDYQKLYFGKKNQFVRALQKPWSIQMQYGIDIDDIPRFSNYIEESDFTILEDILLNGSFFYNARLVDNYSGSLFDITTTGKKFDVFPVKQRDMNSSMRFYQFVVSQIDTTAKVG